MKNYKMSDRAKAAGKGGKGAQIVLPPIVESTKAKKAYLTILRAMLRDIGKAGRTARSAFEFDLLSQIAARLALSSETLVRNILRLEAQQHTTTFMATAKKTLGVDLSDVVLQEDLGEFLQNAGLRNAGLIKNLSADAVQRVQHTVTDALIKGTPVRDLQAKLTEQLRISDRRAQLIAQDQMNKLNADLNRIRHQQAGINEYQWMTSHDERVRERHKHLDGKTYQYGKPTPAEDGLPPGQPIRCRCIARAIVQF